MLRIGLSGGLASGKSTVARLLQAKGAVVIDADRVGHAVLAPGGPGVPAVLERFGSAVLAPGGGIDRARLGGIVFSDRQALQDLEAITHPLIYAETMRRLLAPHDPGTVLVVDAPLLVETGGRSRLGLQALVVVVAGVEDQVARALRRGTPPERVAAVMAAQAPLEAKMAAADYLVDNRGTLADLEESVDTLWAELSSRFPAER